jgi:glycosyltransferase involved in cell wall biosynthesis
MKIALSCNNKWGAGGQGGCLTRASKGLSKLGDLTVFCKGIIPIVEKLPFHINEIHNSAFEKKAPFFLKKFRRRNLAILLNDFFFDKKVAKYLTEDSYGLFVGVAGQCNLSFKAIKKKGGKVILYCLNSYLPFMDKQIKQELKTLGDPLSLTHTHPKMLQRFTEECNLSDLILLNSVVAKKTFIEAGFSKQKLAVITPSVDTTRFHPVPKKDSMFRVLYVGTIQPRKGVQYLIPAFLKAKISHSELLLIGGYSTRSTRQMVEKALQHSNIKQEFWDFSRDDPTKVFGKCSVLVLPSVEDGFGLVVLEAMACGLPIIITSHCGAADIVEEGINGFVIPPRNIETIIEKLNFLAKNPFVCKEMGKAARATAEKFNQDKYNKYLKQILIDKYIIFKKEKINKITK